MSSGLLTVPAVTAVLVVALGTALAVTLLAAVVRGRRERRRLADSLAASREELHSVQRRLDDIARRLEETPPVPPGGVRADEPEYLITTAGTPAAAPAHTVAPRPPQQLSASQFVSVALGESLVTLAALGYGVRRALAAENRNRIAFEMRREVRRSRKQRRRDLKEGRRRLRDPGAPGAGRAAQAAQDAA